MGGKKKEATRVLVVDDDREIRETIRSLLEEEGYSVTEAGDGIAALELLRSSQPTVVLLDLMMPRLDGAGVLGAVAGDKKLVARHVFLLVTATSQTLPLAFVNLLTNLSVPVIRKPFDVDDLLAKVQTAARQLG